MFDQHEESEEHCSKVHSEYQSMVCSTSVVHTAIDITSGIYIYIIVLQASHFVKSKQNKTLVKVFFVGICHINHEIVSIMSCDWIADIFCVTILHAKSASRSEIPRRTTKQSILIKTCVEVSVVLLFISITWMLYNSVAWKAGVFRQISPLPSPSPPSQLADARHTK